MKKNDELLKKAYAEAKADIANLLGWFDCEMEKQPANLNWGHLGSLNKVKADLIETLSFLSGTNETMFQDGLAESRIDTETRNHA